MLGYLSADIICSEKRTVFRERSSRKTVSYEEQIMSEDKYPSLFSPQMETTVFIILQIFFATRTILKIGEYINNSLHLARKYAKIFVSGHYLFREPNSFPRAKLEENCELRGTDNVQGQISEHIFAYYWRLLSLLSFKSFFATHKVLKIGEYSRIFPSFSWGIFGHVTC